MIDLHNLKGIGYHHLRNARENRESTAVPLAFMGIVSIAIGATLIGKAL